MSDWKIIREAERFDRLVKSIDRVAPKATMRAPAGGLMEFIPRVSPTYAQPRHLAPLIDVLERAHKEKLRVVVACAPRLGKTESFAHAPAHCWLEDPSVPWMYAAANAPLVLSKSSRVRDIAIAAGVRLSTSSKSKQEFLTVDRRGRHAGGGLRAFSVEGSPIGHGCRVLVLDDVIASRAQAASARERDRVWSILQSGYFTRVEPNGSIIIIQQRLDEDDPAGRALAEGWDEIRITPFNEDGGSIWPERFDMDHWRELEIEVGPLNWQSQYLQNPRPTEERLFGDAILCDASDVPPDGVTIIGCDLAYTSSSRSDDQAAVVMKRSGDRFFILDGVSRRANLTTEIRGNRRDPGFTQDLRRLQSQYGAREIVQYTGGREDATISLLAKLDADERVRIRGMHAVSDKLQRIQPFLGAYRAGRVEIVRGKFADQLVAHLQQYTGIRGGKDDLGDACAASFDALKGGGGGARGRARGTGDGDRNAVWRGGWAA